MIFRMFRFDSVAESWNSNILPAASGSNCEFQRSVWRPRFPTLKEKLTRCNMAHIHCFALASNETFQALNKVVDSGEGAWSAVENSSMPFANLLG
jgi:hypothetical protein